MTVQLKLDAAALAALFPEGTEARVELQNAVIAEFLKKYIRPNIIQAELETHLKQAQHDAVLQVLKESGIRKSTWGTSFEFPQTFINSLQSQVREKLQDEISDRIRSYMDSEETKSSIEGRVKQAIEQRFGRALDEAVNARIQQIKNSL